MLRGLRHPAGIVRGKAVYACDELAELTPKIVATLERLADDKEVATSMAWFLPNVRRLGRRAELMVPMLAKIVKRGPSPGLIRGGKTGPRAGDPHGVTAWATKAPCGIDTTPLNVVYYCIGVERGGRA